MNFKHGEGRHSNPTREYRAWNAMKRRCYNPNVERYPIYGGRGITVVDRWRDSYEAFLADMGRCPAGLSLDRIDSDGNYEPSNCRWVDASSQRQNRRDYVSSLMRQMYGPRHYTQLTAPEKQAYQKERVRRKELAVA